MMSSLKLDLEELFQQQLEERINGKVETLFSTGSLMTYRQLLREVQTEEVHSYILSALVSSKSERGFVSNLWAADIAGYDCQHGANDFRKISKRYGLNLTQLKEDASRPEANVKVPLSLIEKGPRYHLHSVRTAVYRGLVRKSLQVTNGNQSAAARLFKMDRKNFMRLYDTYDIFIKED